MQAFRMTPFLLSFGHLCKHEYLNNVLEPFRMLNLVVFYNATIGSQKRSDEHTTCIMQAYFVTGTKTPIDHQATAHDLCKALGSWPYSCVIALRCLS